jgi:hypothetical protein
MAFYDADRFKPWQHNAFIGALVTQELIRLQFDGDKVVHEERLLGELKQRIRDVRQGPDGYLYVLTDEENAVQTRPEVTRIITVARIYPAGLRSSPARRYATTGKTLATKAILLLLAGIQNHRRPQFPGQTAHLLELAMADRHMLAVHGLAMLAVIDIGIMQVDEIVVAIGDHHPMRGLERVSR